MTQVATPQVRSVPTVRDLALRALLAIAILVPATVLFGQVWQAKSDQVTAVALERNGVAYLRTLIPLTSALSYAESVAVSGAKVDYTAVDHALAAVAEADKSSSISSGTRDRLSGLNTKIQQLHTHAFTSPLDAYNNFSAITALTLALAEEVRTESGLIRDPSADVYFLEDGAARQMPASIVAAGQYGDLVAIAIGQSSNAREATIGEIASARAMILNAASELGDDVQKAVDAEPSETLSGTLPSLLDQFRLSIDAMVPAAAMPNQLPTSSDGSMALTDKAKVELAATALSTAMLDAVDRLLTARAGASSSDRTTALIVFGILVLVAIIPLAYGAYRRQRRRRRFTPGAPPEPLEREPGTGPSRVDAATGALPRREGTRARELRELSSAPR